MRKCETLHLPETVARGPLTPLVPSVMLVPAAGDIGPTGPTGPTGTAQDLLPAGGRQYGGTGMKMAPMGAPTSYDPTTGGVRADYSMYNAPAPGPVPGMDGASGS